jgi:hypothetical protein
VSQHAVPTQVELAQQPMPGAPQREHAPTVHRKPGEQSVPVAAHVSLTGSQQSLALLHVEPVQHAWVVPPQTVHLPRTQATLLPPVHPVPPSVVQQGSPSPPHVVQLPFTQARGPASPVGLHSEAPAQHGCPLEPQVVHEPFAAGQTVTPASPVAQAPPLLTHVAVTGSQQPPGQLAFAQQSSPAAPHAVHEPFALGQNARPASLPAQAVPLVTHLAVTGSQQPPGQVAFAQQTSPVAPHPVHDPEMQTEASPSQSAPLATQLLVPGSQQPVEHVLPPSPEQHARPGIPHA